MNPYVALTLGAIVVFVGYAARVWWFNHVQPVSPCSACDSEIDTEHGCEGGCRAFEGYQTRKANYLYQEALRRVNANHDPCGSCVKRNGHRPRRKTCGACTHLWHDVQSADHTAPTPARKTA